MKPSTPNRQERRIVLKQAVHLLPPALCLLLAASVLCLGALRIKLKSGDIVQGEKISENLNFIMLQFRGSTIPVLKSLIDTMTDIAEEALLSVSEPAAHSRPPTPPDTTQPEARTEADTATPRQENVPSVVNTPAALETATHDAATIEIVNLSYQGIEEIPPEIFRLPNLRRLDLKGNRIKELPPEIGDLTKMTDLDLRFNQIKTLPPQMSNLTGLSRLYLTGNRLSVNEQEHVSRIMPFTQIVNSSAPVFRSQNSLPERMSPSTCDRIDSLESMCAAGRNDACLEAGVLYKQHSDTERALHMFEKGAHPESASSHDAMESCAMNAADIHYCILRNRDRAIPYYQRLCKEKKSAHCEKACERLHDARRR